MAVESLTRFPGGIAQHTAFSVGGAAGDLTVVSGIGLRAGDLLLSVVVLDLDTNGAITSAVDLTSEFTITADATINNTGGTATTGNIVAVTFAQTAE